MGSRVDQEQLFDDRVRRMAASPIVDRMARDGDRVHCSGPLHRFATWCEAFEEDHWWWLWWWLVMVVVVVVVLVMDGDGVGDGG